MTRRVVWEGHAERIIMDASPRGGVTLMRTTDYDSGPARSFEIPAGAVTAVAAGLMGEGEFEAILGEIDRRCG